MSVIEWTREPRRILLPVRVLAPYPVTNLGGVEALALVDTGSSVSGVASRLAEQLGLLGLGKRPLTSAQGLGQVQRYAFRLAIQPDQDAHQSASYPYVFEEVVGIELTNTFEFTALIGMDILRQCDLLILRDGTCRLSFGT